MSQPAVSTSHNQKLYVHLLNIPGVDGIQVYNIFWKITDFKICLFYAYYARWVIVCHYVIHSSYK